MTRNVLIVEDNPGIGELVRMHVADLGLNPILCDRGDTGLERFREGDIDLVVLDLMLPGMDGLSVCREIRSGPAGVDRDRVGGEPSLPGLIHGEDTPSAANWWPRCPMICARRWPPCRVTLKA